MATYNTQSIKVPIETQLQVKDTIEGIKRLRQKLEEQFKNVDPASSLGKSLARLRAKIDQSFANIDASNLGSELFDEGDFKKVLNYVNQINQQLQQMRVQGTTATAKALGIDTKEIEEATKKLQELKDEYKQFKNRSVEKDNPAELARFEQHKKATGFNAKQSYQRNIDRLTTVEQRAKNDFEALNTEESKAARAEAESKFKEAERLANEAKTEYSKAADALKNAKTEQSKQEQAKIDYNVAQELKKVNAHTSPGRGKPQIISEYQEKIQSLIATKGGNFQKDGKKYAQSIAKWLDMSEGEIETLLSNRADVIVAQLNEKLNAAMTKNMRPFVAKVDAAYAAGYNGEELTKANAAVTEAQNKEAAARVNLDAKEAALTTAKSEHNKAVETFNKAEALLKEIQEQIELLKSLQKQLEEAADAEYSSKIKDAEKAQETAQQESTKETREQQTSTSTKIAEETKKVSQTYQETHQGNQDARAAEAEAERAQREVEAQIAAENRRQQQEAEQFKQNLQHTINQWMSAQQVINLVKDGIRQAYQDIQGLDAAMTNIAVVTDMSVGDLWGKINEYMSIAQQYGVTTQGVYEVSQLYYQQGLSTNEVMAATTETLKMARIAGMGYAEAADAMTVAIRAFKMEMSDASHVTDVYSKVAAVTASDTEELAIAMSKTASSAESVGSSFENTTAMLAVMIETTRESAQNLGSALKSIISRYGEMKQGLTQDSDGEIIDYNKTDAALRSIGISIKDAQGQFRDFDDVIFELSSKWDSLDKNTQRYIATIMAGNRQQSRFIALVDNWERLDEVSQAAADSADAGLLQYAKTLDSLDTKINTLKTNFQQFYMAIFDGEFFKGFIDIINNIVENLSRVGPILGTINLLQLVNQIKLLGQLLVNAFSSSFTKIIKAKKDWENSFTTSFGAASKKTGDTLLDKFLNHVFPSLKSESAKAGSDIGENLSNGITESITTASQQWMAKIQEFVNQAKASILMVTTSLKADPTTVQGLMTRQNNHFISKNQFNNQGKDLFNSYMTLAQTGKKTNTRQYKNLSEYEKFLAGELQAGGSLDYGAYQSRMQVESHNSDITAQNAVLEEFFTKLLEAGERFKEIVTGAAEEGADEERQGEVEGIQIEVEGEAEGARREVEGEAEGARREVEGEDQGARREVEGAQEEANIETTGAHEEAAIERRNKIGAGVMAVGTALTTAGMMVDQSTMKGYDTSTGLQAAGGALSAIGQAATGNYIGAAVTAITGVITAFQRISKRAEAELDNAKKASEAANVERAQTKDTYNNLQSLLKKYEQAQINRYNDEESYQEWLDVNNQLVEAYPELLGYIDAEGHAIANVTSKTEILSYYMQKAAEASKQYYDAKIAETTQKIRVNREHKFSADGVNLFSDNALNPFGEQYSAVQTVIYEASPYYTVTGMESGHFTSENLVKFANDKGYNLWQTLSDMQMYGKGHNPLADFLYLYGVIVKNSSGNFEFEQHFSEYLTGYEDYQNLSSYSKGGAMSNINLLLSNEERDNLFDSIEGYESLMYTYATVIKGNEEDILRYMTAGSDIWNGLIEEYTGLYSSFSESQQQIVGSLFSNLGNYSLLDVQEILKNDLKLDDESHGLYKTFVAQWYERNYHQLANWTERYGEISGINYSIKNENSAFSKGLDIHNWIQRKAEIEGDSTTYSLDNIDNLYDDYYIELEAALGENDPFFKFIKQNGDATINAYLDYLADEKKLITTHGDGYSIAQSREEWMKQIVADSTQVGSELNTILANNEEARNEFWSIIFTDVGTYGWAQNVAAWGQKYNYDEFADAEQYAYENYTIRLQTIIDSTAAAVKTLKEFAQKQSSGFTWEESQKYLKQIQQLDPAQTWHNLFSVNEQGLIVLKDFAQTADLLYLSSVKSVQEESKQAQKVVDTLSPRISSRERRGKLFQPTMTMDEVFMLANEHLYGEGIDANSFSKETYVKFENAIKTGEITDTFDLIKWYNNLPKEERAAGILQHEKDGIEQAFKDGGLTDLSEESYDKALELARTINSAYGLNFDETSEDFQTLVSQIRAGQITSVETLLSFYQGIADKANAANDVFVKQARLLLANTSFSTWAEPFTKGTEAKKLATLTSGSYSDLQNLWVQRLEQDWKAIMGDSQPRYEKGDQILENGEIVTIDENHQLFGQIKENLNDWDSSDYNAYFTAQSEALKSHGASLDAFGNLIIKDWEAWGTYIAESYGFIENGVIKDQDAYNAIMAQAKAAYLKNIEAYETAIEEGYTSLVESFAQDEEITFDEVSKIADSLLQQGVIDEGTYGYILQAYEEAKKNGADGIYDFISLLGTYIENIPGSNIDLSKINSIYKDTKQSIIKEIFGGISSAISGTLKYSELDNLAELLGIDNIQQYTTQTIEGLRLNAEGLLVLGARLQEQYGDVLGTAEKLVELTVGENKLFNGYEDILKAIAELEAKGKNITKEEQRQLDLLQQMARVARTMANDPAYDFMNQDRLNGLGGPWKTYRDNVKQVTSILDTLNKDGSADIYEFQNAMLYMGERLGDDVFKYIGISAAGAQKQIKSMLATEGGRDYLSKTFGITADNFSSEIEKFGNGAQLYELYVNTIIAANGKLDINAKALDNFGLSIGGIADGMDKSVSDMADSQIEFLTGIKEMLEALRVLEELGSIGDIQLFDPAPDGNNFGFGKDVVFTISNYEFYLDKMTPEAQGRLQGQIQNELITFFDNFQGQKFNGDEVVKSLFGEDGFTITDETERHVLDGLIAFKEMSGDQWQAFALQYPEAFKDSKIDWKAIADILTQGFDPKNFAANIDANTLGKVRTELNALAAKGGSLYGKINIDDKGIITVDPKSIADWEQKIRPELVKAFEKQGVFVELSINKENGKVTVHYINPQVHAIIEDAKKQDQTVTFNDSTQTYEVRGGTLNYNLNANNGDIQVTDENGNPYTSTNELTEDQLAALRAMGYGETPLTIDGKLLFKYEAAPEGVDPIAGLSDDVAAIRQLIEGGSALKLTIETSEMELAQTTLEAIIAAWKTLLEWDQTTITLNVNQGGNINGSKAPGEGANAETSTSMEISGGVEVPLTINKEGFISQLVTLYTDITNNTIGVELPVVKTLAQWDEENNPTSLKTEIESQSASMKAKATKDNSSFKQVEQALNELTKDRTVTIKVTEKPEGSSTSDETEQSDSGGPGGAGGNVRFATVAAKAKGNFSNLLAGAAFARGTLMGELGPELYVQGGQYHIAGANGPEFVDLHNDAIVFNHLQTAKLLNKGHINSHGSPVTDERTAVAYATGNVSGPARAGNGSNIQDAIDAVSAAISLWQSIKEASIKSMLDASRGGGGGSDSVTAVTVELQEWYNLTRKIAEVEERINKLLAERENIEKRNGAAYLRNLREEQQYWREQLAYESTLAAYQQAQLDREREAIENSDIFGQFFIFDEQGNIQFRNGNERDDGKGTLEFLQDLKAMSLEDQIKTVEELGYTYTTADGKELEGEKLVTQFLKDIDDRMKSYENLYDTAQKAETKIEQIRTNIEKVEQQIKDNQMDLEQDIYDTIVDAQEKVIEGLEEQKDLIEEANKAYVDGLNNALKAEKDLYSKNESISDREQLQRQLSLLRRSGGSASEIAALEEQLNDMLKNEYFSNQEEMIKDIEEANKEQIRKLEEQIRLQEEALEYQKEHGLIWSQVADIMSHDSDYILDFLQGNSTDFFAQSMMQQEQMLTEWAHKIGIFTEDRLMQNFKDEEADMWKGDKPQIFDSMEGELGTGDKKTSYGDFFSTLSDENKKLVQDSYLQAYAEARKEGKTEEEARKIAQEKIKTTLGDFYDASLAPSNEPPSAQPEPGSGDGSMYVTGGALNVREKPDKNSKKLGQLPNGTKVSILEKTSSDWYKIQSGNLTGYVMSKYLTGATSGGEGPGQRWEVKYSFKATKEDGTAYDGITSGSGKGATEQEAKQNAWYWAEKRMQEAKNKGYKISGLKYKDPVPYMTGGLVDYTGPAIVHGTPSKPEAFLNAKQTAMISEAIRTTGDGGALDGIKATLAALNSTIKGIVNNNTNTTSSFTVAPGAVTIQVAELSDSYDVEELSKDVMNRIVAIASKSTNRGVNRR